MDEVRAAHLALGCAHREGCAGAAPKPNLASLLWDGCPPRPAVPHHLSSHVSIYLGSAKAIVKGLQGGPWREDLWQFPYRCY